MSPFSYSVFASYFAFPSVSKLVLSQFLIPRVFPGILQLIGSNCEVIVLLGITINNADWECLQAYQFYRVLKNWDLFFFWWYMKYLDSLWITFLLTYQLILPFKSRLDSSKPGNNWVSNVMLLCAVANMEKVWLTASVLFLKSLNL